MIDTAIVLAGGFGTRLQSVVKDLPKPMAPVGDKPFLEYVFKYLIQNGVTKAILSVGYKWETIQQYFGNQYHSLQLEYSIEDTPLGTGGAILKAVKDSGESEFLIINGDTFFNVNLSCFYRDHCSSGTMLTLALKPMSDFDRYGVVEVNELNRVISFREKQFYRQGNINGGVYLLHKSLFNQLALSGKFSFEADVMEKYFSSISFSAFAYNEYFIDIGIPEDYHRSQIELPKLFGRVIDFKVDKSWTLFLDRDGVVNKKIDDDYVRSLDQFEWLDCVVDSIVQLSKQFGRIIIVTNQQGIGKGLMKTEEVEIIHNYICETILEKGGMIDAVYFAPQLKAENSLMRKPNIGMALQAKNDFPEIDFSKSIMVGDSIGDMQFGRNAGMKTVFISKGNSFEPNEMIDITFETLHDFAGEIVK